MANISKMNRDRIIEQLNNLKLLHSDDASLKLVNEIEDALNNKKYGMVFEQHTENVEKMLNNYIPILTEDKEKVIIKDKSKALNFLIEGDNLQALYLLEKTHKGKIDCIYIDPPYNTGAKDWKYNNDYVDKNDTYKHSKWISMMYSRLILAKKLLNSSGSVLICTIDDKEFLNLGSILYELFPQAKITMISSVINPAGKAKKGGVDFSKIDEYIFFVQIGNFAVLPEVREMTKTNLTWETFRRHSLANGRGKQGIGACGPNQFYPIYVNDRTKKIEKIGEPIMKDVDRFSVKSLKGCTTVFPVRDNGIEMNWGATRDEALKRLNKGYLKVGKYFPNAPQKYSIQYLTSGVIKDIENGKITVEGYDDRGGVIGYYYEGRPKMPTTVWNKKSHNATSYGTNILSKIFNNSNFDYPKSLYAVYDCLNIFIANKPNAIVLDFFAGSGTTLHAVNLLNVQDNGNRQCILVTNNEISYLEEKKLLAQGYKKGDKIWEDLGIAKKVTWPRIECFINGKDINGKPLQGNYGVKVEDFVLDNDNKNARRYKKVLKELYPALSKITMSKGFNCNVKYYKCDWVNRKPDDYLLSNALLYHVKEMIELKTSAEIDNKKNVLIINKNDIKNYLLNSGIYNKIQNIWINQNIILNSEELILLKNKNFKFVPFEFFANELKEASE